MSENPVYPHALQQPTSTIIIRPVKLEDVGLLQSCLWQDRDMESIEDFIRRVLKFEAQNRGIGIIVINDTTPSKPIIAYGQITQWVHCPEISDLLVQKVYRGQGIGTAMIQYLTHHALAQHANCVELGVARSNPRALALYQRLGFKDSYTLQLDLGQGTEPVLYLSLDLTPYQ